MAAFGTEEIILILVVNAAALGGLRIDTHAANRIDRTGVLIRGRMMMGMIVMGDVTAVNVAMPAATDTCCMVGKMFSG